MLGRGRRGTSQHDAHTHTHGTCCTAGQHPVGFQLLHSLCARGGDGVAAACTRAETGRQHSLLRLRTTQSSMCMQDCVVHAASPAWHVGLRQAAVAHTQQCCPHAGSKGQRKLIQLSRAQRRHWLAGQRNLDSCRPARAHAAVQSGTWPAWQHHAQRVLRPAARSSRVVHRCGVAAHCAGGCVCA
jgi:hypothetical protein